MSDRHVVVTGGGIAGASVAYHLGGHDGLRVELVERGTPAGETTARSIALFGGYGSDVERDLKRYGRERYNAFLTDPQTNARHEAIGRVRVATTPEGRTTLAEEVANTGTAEFVTDVEPAAIQGTVLLPELDTGPVTGATYRPDVGYHRPRPLAREFLSRARDRGVQVETGTEVIDVTVEDGALASVRLDRESGLDTVRPDALVCAAGPWNPTLAGMADLDLPVHHSLAPVLEYERPEPVPHTLPNVSHVETGVYARGHGHRGVLVGHHPTAPTTGTFDPDNVTDQVPAEEREMMRTVLGDLLPPIAAATLVDEWVGVRSHTPDGHPIVGWTGVDGLAVVAFDSSGIQLAPAAGRMVARQLVDGDPTAAHDALSIARFDGYAERRFTV